MVLRRRPRIIPARAGFTIRPTRRLRRSPDHPRSRGVYYTRLEADDRYVGSSPLARGLHRRRRARVGAPRIIPARAGFTKRDPYLTMRTTDHPRSRGVYARLQPRAGHLPRIIPARAGFTQRYVTRRTDPWDHPRSRGVYSSVSTVSAGGLGSSPLARGLRVQHPSPRWRRADHPRSRGVYATAFHTVDREDGSSPLARGLLPVDVLHDLGLGIIPARAGFTCWPARSASSWADHPRSRGVYRRSRLILSLIPGSSPLARGLPDGEGHVPQRSRIIPARAGFTLADP